ncbi:MAG: manganese efflux pump MntP family protein [Patescibacteria group bacterium]|nr:manganese efflux pump MntP family protein [Patescibacteria group bacterium]
MSLLTIILIGFGLAMDSFAVSVTNGAAVKTMRTSLAIKSAMFFGISHVVMTIIGWYGGVNLKTLISGVDHWIAFGLLTLVGMKMIYESFDSRLETAKVKNLDVATLLILSLATSIDALVVGISFAFLSSGILHPALIIGSIIFVMSFAGVFIGGKIKKIIGKKIEIVGALILIGLGLKILIEHSLT